MHSRGSITKTIHLFEALMAATSIPSKEFINPSGGTRVYTVEQRVSGHKVEIDLFACNSADRDDLDGEQRFVVMFAFVREDGTIGYTGCWTHERHKAEDIEDAVKRFVAALVTMHGSDLSEADKERLLKSPMADLFLNDNLTRH